MSRVFVVAAILLTIQQAAVGQFINSRDLQQDPVKLKVCMARAEVSAVGEFEINMKYIDLTRKMNPDATLVNIKRRLFDGMWDE
jgi:hypothetical protein